MKRKGGEWEEQYRGEEEQVWSEAEVERLRVEGWNLPSSSTGQRKSELSPVLTGMSRAPSFGSICS